MSLESKISLRYDKDALVYQILDGYASLPLSLRQKVSHQMKAKAKAFPDVTPSEVDDFLASAVQVKTSPFAIKNKRKKMGVALTGLLALSYLYLCYEGWKTAGIASLHANRVTQSTLGPLLLYTPATDLQASRSAFLTLQQQLGSLPVSLHILSDNVATLTKKIKDKKARCEHLQDIVEHVERYKLRQVDTLPNAIQHDLQRILLRNILEVPMSSSAGPLLLQNSGEKKQQKKKTPPSLALLLGAQSTATVTTLTTYETGVAEAWLQEWQTTGKMVKESMYRSILNGYLDEKRALWDATKESLIVLETERARLTGEKTQKQQRLALRTLERPVKQEEIKKRTANVLTGKTKFKQQVKVKENVLLRQRLDNVPFSNTEYNLMGQCVLLCTMLMATTGPFRWLALFPSGFSEWLFSVTTATALVVKSSWQGNLVTFGSLLTEVFGLSLNYYTGVSSDFHVDSADQMLFVGILVLMTITYFGYYGVLLLQRLWGVDVRKMQREMARLQKELEQARRIH